MSQTMAARASGAVMARSSPRGMRRSETRRGRARAWDSGWSWRRRRRTVPASVTTSAFEDEATTVTRRPMTMAVEGGGRRQGRPCHERRRRRGPCRRSGGGRSGVRTGELCGRWESSRGQMEALLFRKGALGGRVWRIWRTVHRRRRQRIMEDGAGGLRGRWRRFLTRCGGRRIGCRGRRRG